MHYSHFLTTPCNETSYVLTDQHNENDLPVIQLWWFQLLHILKPAMLWLFCATKTGYWQRSHILTALLATWWKPVIMYLLHIIEPVTQPCKCLGNSCLWYSQENQVLMIKPVTSNMSIWLLSVMKDETYLQIHPCECCTWWIQTYLQYTHMSIVHGETRFTCNTAMWLLYMMKHITYNTATWVLYMMSPDLPAIQSCDCSTWWNQTYLKYIHMTVAHDEKRLICNTAMWLLYMMKHITYNTIIWLLHVIKPDLPAIQPRDCCTW